MSRQDLVERLERLNFVIPQVFLRIQRVPSRPAGAPTLSLPQVRMLLILEMEGDSTMGALARWAAVTMPSATSCINTLVRGHYVTRSRAQQDRRVVLVGLTAKARSFLAALHEERRERLRTILGRLSASDQARLVAAFEAILDLLRKFGEANRPARPLRRKARNTREARLP